MTVTASPHPRGSLLQAVIEDARRRARRRRERYAFCLLLLACAGATAYFSLNGGGGSAVVRTPERIDIAASGVPARNGALTVMDVPVNAQHEGLAGWYGFSMVGGLGRLRTLVRCPDHVRWCGDVESIDWSPDGARLAFGVTSFGGTALYNGIHVVNVRTRRDAQILMVGENREYDWFDIDWAPNGRRLAYSSNGTIALINADGTGRTVLRTGTVGHDHSPSWSPDGAWIAYSSRHEGTSSVYAIRADGSQRRLLVLLGAAPAWSPDGTRIAFRVPAGIAFVTPNGKLLAPRLPFLPGVAVGINGPPVWSPDGKKIAMSNRRYGTYVMNADGTNLRRVTSYAAGIALGQPIRPAWRPRDLRARR